MAVDTNLPSSSARAASAEEARFRIDRPIAPSRAGRVVALDEGAADVVTRVAGLAWANARFYACDPYGTDAGTMTLRGVDGGPATLADELASASVVVMVATSDAGAGCAEALGRACWERGVQTAGLVLGDGTHGGTAASAAVAALRPHARVLLPSASEQDVVDVLLALRV